MTWRKTVVAMAALILAGCSKGADREHGRGAVVLATGSDSGAAVAPVEPEVVDAGPLLVAAPAPAPAPVPVPEEPPLALVHDCVGNVDHLARARELRESGDVAGGLLEARRALHHEVSVEGLEETALLARRHGDRELAMRLYSALAERTSDDPLPLVKLARLAIEKRDWETARNAGSDAIQRDPTSPEAHHLRGRANLNLRNLTAAIRDFRKASALDPRQGWSHNNLGFAYLLADDPENALEPLQEAARLLPREARVLNNLGIALERLGRTEEAGDAYAEAIALDPAYVKAIVNKVRLTQLASAAPLPSLEVQLPADGLDLEGAPLPSDSGLEDLGLSGEFDPAPGVGLEL